MKKGDTFKEHRIQKDTYFYDVAAGIQHGCLFSHEDVWTIAGGFREFDDGRLYSDGNEKVWVILRRGFNPAKCECPIYPACTSRIAY